jgi:hypothetical protein
MIIGLKLNSNQNFHDLFLSWFYYRPHLFVVLVGFGAFSNGLPHRAACDINSSVLSLTASRLIYLLACSRISLLGLQNLHFPLNFHHQRKPPNSVPPILALSIFHTLSCGCILQNNLTVSDKYLLIRSLVI